MLFLSLCSSLLLLRIFKTRNSKDFNDIDLSVAGSFAVGQIPNGGICLIRLLEKTVCN